MNASAPPSALDEMINRLQGLPVMPAIALELIHSLTAADTDVDALAHRIVQDQAIAARVLRVANSPFYGLQTRVASIHDAIVVLGFSAVRSLVLTAAVVQSLPVSHCPEFSAGRFWRHVIGTAAAAQALARPLRRKPELLFVAGLLHDIGRLVMVVLSPAEYRQVLAQARARDCRLMDLELELFGFDHTTVGAALARRWNFPGEIVDALAWHHQPHLAPPGGLAPLIHYADAISQALDLEEAEDSQLPTLQPDTVDALGLDWDTLTQVLAETQARFDSYRPMMA